MVPFPICHSEAGGTSALINIYTVPFHHEDANDTHQRCSIRWGGKSLRSPGERPLPRELGSGPMSYVTLSPLPSRRDQTVSMTGRGEFLGGRGTHSTLSTRRAGSRGSCDLLSRSIISVRMNDKIPEPPKKGSN